MQRPLRRSIRRLAFASMASVTIDQANVIEILHSDGTIGVKPVTGMELTAY
jgi:hypothetical protein